MAFSFSSAINNLVNGLTNNASDVVTCFNDVKAVLNNGITGTDHLSASAAIAGSQLSSTAQIKQGQIGGSGGNKVNTTATESRTNTAYGTLTTPDQVASVVLPTDGLIAVAYQATWQESVNGAARAALFVGANQIKIYDPAQAGPVVQETIVGNAAGTANVDRLLNTTATGLGSPSASPAPAYTGDVTTGQVLGAASAGAPCYIFAAAGTYTISVQFKSTSGSVTAKNRKLWVWTLGF